MKHMSLALVVLLLGLTPVQAQFPEEIKGSIAFVTKLQTKSGGFLNEPPVKGKKAEPTLRATSSAVRALKYLGAEVPAKDACKRFVESCFDAASGGFADVPGGKPDVATTAIGIMAVVELGMPTAKYADPVVKYLNTHANTFEEIRIAVAGLERLERPAPRAKEWQELVQKMANADGTFGKGEGAARATGSAVVTLLRLGGKVENKEKVLKVLNDGQRLSGGFGKEEADTADLESSYRVMRAYHMLKAQPGSPDTLSTFVSKCRNGDGGYGIAPGEPSSIGATYFAFIIYHWLKNE